MSAIASGHPTGDEELGRRVVAKVARRLIPFMMLLYFVNYLDRTNIGFAELQMSEDLGLTATAYGLASGLFFIGYLFFEVPSNLALHKFGARRWIARIMLSWGIVASAMAFVPNAGSLYAMRVLLGVAEAGFFPGMILFLTYWFPRRERARFTAMFLAAIPLSSAIGAPVSAAIMQYCDGLFGLEGWRVMFLFEGMPAVLLAFVTWFYLTDRPEKATWLTDEERGWLTREMEAEKVKTEKRFHWPLRKSLTNPRILGLSFVYFGVVYGLYALSFFLPQIVADFSKTFNTKFSLLETGLIVAVPFLIGTVSMVLWGRHSDRTQERVRHVALPTALAALTIPVALYLDSPFAVMVAVTLTAIGIFGALPVFWSLPGSFLVGASAAGGIALINSLGNLAGFGAPFITGWLTDVTGSQKSGLWVVGVVMMLAAVVVVAMGASPRPDDTEEEETDASPAGEVTADR
ncbi:MAG: MFS transporter [Streptomyces sp.]|uniref:MFS transporter n=1 Tax=Streptomyces sp. TaxID=1931 RepID=UPI003D6B317D